MKLSKAQLEAVFRRWEREEAEAIEVIEAVGAFLGPALPSTRAETDPVCEISGRCEPIDDASGISNCMHCGAEMHSLKAIGWVRWDHPAALSKDTTNAE